MSGRDNVLGFPYGTAKPPQRKHDVVIYIVIGFESQGSSLNDFKILQVEYPLKGSVVLLVL